LVRFALKDYIYKYIYIMDIEELSDIEEYILWNLSFGITVYDSLEKIKKLEHYYKFIDYVISN